MTDFQKKLISIISTSTKPLQIMVAFSDLADTMKGVKEETRDRNADKLLKEVTGKTSEYFLLKASKAMLKEEQYTVIGKKPVKDEV